MRIPLQKCKGILAERGLKFSGAKTVWCKKASSVKVFRFKNMLVLKVFGVKKVSAKGFMCRLRYF